MLESKVKIDKLIVELQKVAEKCTDHSLTSVILHTEDGFEYVIKDVCCENETAWISIEEWI